MQKVDYSPFATNFAASRKNMKWPEISYFLDFLKKKSLFAHVEEILDVGCGSGRLLEHIEEEKTPLEDYLGIDISEELLCEAKESFPNFSFELLDMRDIYSLQKKYTTIFFIASFHHLGTLEQRIQVLGNASTLLKDGGYICMTNWALSAGKNTEKYEKCFLRDSQNQFGSKDYEIPFGRYKRYYHDFSLQELGYLATNASLYVVENRFFEGENNIISIFQKKNEK